MKKTGLAKERVLRDHTNKDWKVAHNIWANVKDIMTRIFWKSTPSDLAGSITEDGAWHDLDLTSYTTEKTKGVIISVLMHRLLAAGGSPSDIWIYTRKNGSSASFEGILRKVQVSRADGGASINYYFGGMLIQACDTGEVIEYKVESNTVIDNFLILGYWE